MHGHGGQLGPSHEGDRLQVGKLLLGAFVQLRELVHHHELRLGQLREGLPPHPAAPRGAQRQPVRLLFPRDGHEHLRPAEFAERRDVPGREEVGGLHRWELVPLYGLPADLGRGQVLFGYAEEGRCRRSFCAVPRVFEERSRGGRAAAVLRPRQGVAVASDPRGLVGHPFGEVAVPRSECGDGCRPHGPRHLQGRPRPRCPGRRVSRARLVGRRQVGVGRHFRRDDDVGRLR
mmetsp:Transcript_4905/g.14728  ORF Transcript_4905/g.14728 Transcript_4905/m.14728 type:complete len:232 (-) Transcript_4905:428-1123(-)